MRPIYAELSEQCVCGQACGPVQPRPDQTNSPLTHDPS